MKSSGHEFEGEQEGVYGRFRQKKGRQKCCNYYNLKKLMKVGLNIFWKGVEEDLIHIKELQCGNAIYQNVCSFSNIF